MGRNPGGCSIVLIVLASLMMVSCRGCFTSYPERKASVLKVCPTCTFVTSEGQYVAVDTAKRPNIVYRVYFKDGGMYYNASDVDHLVRIN